MVPLALGVVVLFTILFLFRGIATADPKFLIRIFRYVGAGVCAVLAILLALTGRLPIAFLLGSVAWGLATGGQIWPYGWPHVPGGAWPSVSTLFHGSCATTPAVFQEALTLSMWPIIGRKGRSAHEACASTNGLSRTNPT